MTAPAIGWIGAGRMGYQLATRLLNGGHDVAVYNRTRAKAEPLTEKGAKIVDRPIDLADRDIVFIMVSTSDDLHHVLFGDGGLLTDPDRTPRIIVDSSTVSTDASAKAREGAAARGTEFLAAPVSGNPKVIAAGKLTVAVSGPRAVFDEVQPLLALFGRGTTYVGEGEVARLVKIAHNVYLGVVTQSLAEITTLVERGGVERGAFMEFLNDSVMGSIFSRYKSPALVNLDFHPTFTNILLRKDMQLGLSAGKELGVPMPLAAATDMLVAEAIGAGHVEQDFATLLLEQARRSGYELVAETVPFDDGLAPEASA
ncbi:NAD(P)-dependent oxidoreductase [Microbacterium capsulatum]|uniref:NAD(P)-dependent oxidoreductase n=1 Tax=Microbacterium capsulatum TaxID=3041921 RepID=A0ABU0XHT6_9MICO|nr:NAD(P)-dependent oxidoreductase [Microbacterium sp. ASV81]MDQ4214693.1 NAD(P)-dependent oxidoreductase [Microbacterium sp. ASV81]